MATKCFRPTESSKQHPALSQINLPDDSSVASTFVARAKVQEGQLRRWAEASISGWSRDVTKEAVNYFL